MALRANVPIKLGPLVTINVSVETAVQREDSLHTVCVNGHDATRVKQTKACPTCSATDGFMKGQMVGGAYTVVDESAVKEAVEADTAVKESMVITAHDLTEVQQSTLPGDSTYYLSPSKGYDDSYAVLRDLVANNPDEALCTIFAVRGKPAMWRLGVYGDTVTLNKLVWPEDVKAVPANIPSGEADAATVEMASQFLKTLHADFSPDLYRDTAKAARADLLAAGQSVNAATTGSDSSPAAVTDLLSAFKASVEAAEVKPKPAARKRAAKKTVAA